MCHYRRNRERVAFVVKCSRQQKQHGGYLWWVAGDVREAWIEWLLDIDVWLCLLWILLILIQQESVRHFGDWPHCISSSTDYYYDVCMCWVIENNENLFNFLPMAKYCCLINTCVCVNWCGNTPHPLTIPIWKSHGSGHPQRWPLLNGNRVTVWKIQCRK